MTLWQQLGAFTYTATDLSEDQIGRFASVGGRWLVPVLYGDDIAGPKNMRDMKRLKAVCPKYAIRLGCWANCVAGDPHEDAKAIGEIVVTHRLDPVILDCEAAYQEHPDVFPVLLKAVRTMLPENNLCVSTNSLNDSLIWNGRGLSPRESARKLGYRVAPQWYNSPRYSGCWTDPVCNMAWLKEHGDEDNLFDPSYKNKRAVPLSYVHPTIEVTGLEGASMVGEVWQLEQAKQYGLTPGFSVYTLENMPGPDFAVLNSARTRGLYL